MQKKVTSYIEKYQMVMPGDYIVAGVSGGADSVCMLLQLYFVCKEKGADLVVVHVNHGIRDEASTDAEFVRCLCENLQVTFILREVDILKEAEKLGIGTEEAGRLIRYQIFEELSKPYGRFGKIAVAHNKNDLAETMLFHLFRGSSIAGLSGILPVRDRVIRPLLCVERSEIEEYLLNQDVLPKKWCIDCTNKENTYTRNKIRNQLFPFVEENICSQAMRHVASAAEEMAEVREYIEEQAVKAYRESVVIDCSENKAVITLSEIMKCSHLIQRQVVLKILDTLTLGRKDITSTHILDIVSLFNKETGKQIHLPYNLLAERTYETVVIRQHDLSKIGYHEQEVTIPGELCFSGVKMEFRVFSAQNTFDIQQKTYTKWFDYDKINNCLVVRNRKTGDYLTINKEGNHKSLKEYFITEKIPRDKRDQMLLLADGSHIIWIIGKRISEYYKVTEETKNILEVTVYN